MDNPTRHWAREEVGGEVILEVVELFDDDTLSWAFDITDAVRTKQGWYIASTAGCSCPSYEEVAEIVTGPHDELAVAVHRAIGDRMSNRFVALTYQREVMGMMQSLYAHFEQQEA